MLPFFKPRKKSEASSNTYVFYGTGVIDVTNFEAVSPGDSLGYMCGGDIAVLQNGQIEIYGDECGEGAQDAKELLESFSVAGIIKANNHVHNFVPDGMASVSVITNSKAFTFTFQNQESKDRFWNAMTTVYDNLTKSN